MSTGALAVGAEAPDFTLAGTDGGCSAAAAGSPARRASQVRSA